MLGPINTIIDNKILIQERDKQLVKRKKKYQWQHHNHGGLPGFLDTSNQNLSIDENFEKVKNTHFTADVIKAGKFLLSEAFNELNHNLTEGDFMDLAEKNGAEGETRWASDAEYGNQLLNGINPVVIEKCTSASPLPDNFPVTHEMVQDSLDPGKVFEEEMEVCMTSRCVCSSVITHSYDHG